MILLRFCIFFLKLNIAHPTVNGHMDLLQDMLEVCQAAVNVTMVHSHGAWLRRECARRPYFEIMVVLRGYAVLGRKCIQLGYRCFVSKPKLHALHHLAVALKTSLQSGACLVLSPQVMACEANEDFIGRISRLSRRVGFRSVDLRVCQRVFMKMYALHKRRKQQRAQAKLCAPKARPKAIKIRRPRKL